MFKVVVGQRDLSTAVSMLINTLQLFKMITWTLKYCNVKIAGNGDTQRSYVEFKVLSVLNATDLTNHKTIMNSDGVARQMRRQILCASKQRKRSHARIHSNAPIIRTITKWIQIYVCSGGIGLTGNGIRRSTLRSMKTESNWFVLLWTVTLNNDFQRSKDFFLKNLKELPHCQYHS